MKKSILTLSLLMTAGLSIAGTIGTVKSAVLTAVNTAYNISPKSIVGAVCSAASMTKNAFMTDYLSKLTAQPNNLTKYGSIGINTAVVAGTVYGLNRYFDVTGKLARKFGKSAVEVQASEVKAPKVEAPKVEAPKVEAPKVEAPKDQAGKIAKRAAARKINAARNAQA